MSPETIERLILDKALGALPADCQALLEAYLESRPSEMASCRSTEDLLGRVRIAMTDGVAQPLPSFPAGRLSRVRRIGLTGRVAMSVAAVAACVLLGFGLHAMVFPDMPLRPDVPKAVLVVQVDAVRPAQAHRDGDGFWSGRRLSEQATEAPQPTPSPLIWGSPARTPRLGGAS